MRRSARLERETWWVVRAPAFLAVLRWQGRRAGAVWRLAWLAVSFERDPVRARTDKKRRERWVPMADETHAALEAYGRRPGVGDPPILPGGVEGRHKLRLWGHPVLRTHRSY